MANNLYANTITVVDELGNQTEYDIEAARLGGDAMNKGDESHPVYFSNGVPVECGEISGGGGGDRIVITPNPVTARKNRSEKTEVATIRINDGDNIVLETPRVSSGYQKVTLFQGSVTNENESHLLDADFTNFQFLYIYLSDTKGLIGTHVEIVPVEPLAQALPNNAIVSCNLFGTLGLTLHFDSNVKFTVDYINKLPNYDTPDTTEGGVGVVLKKIEGYTLGLSKGSWGANTREVIWTGEASTVDSSVSYPLLEDMQLKDYDFIYVHGHVSDQSEEHIDLGSVDYLSSKFDSNTALLTCGSLQNITKTLRFKNKEFYIDSGTDDGSLTYIVTQIDGIKYGAEANQDIDPTLYMQKGIDYVTAGYNKTSGSSTGLYATIEGYNNIASGDYSHAEGRNTRAIGEASHAEGHGVANGDVSHAENSGETDGIDCHAEGTGFASGDASHAEGYGTSAAGECCHSEGYQTEAYGQGAHAEGFNCAANGRGAHAEGYGTYAINEYETTSHAEGEDTTAYGPNAHAEGLHTYAYDCGAHAGGVGTSAKTSGYRGDDDNYVYRPQYAIGAYNEADENGLYAFIIGDGTDNLHRSNLFTVGWDGVVRVHGNPIGGGGSTVIPNPSGSAIDDLNTIQIDGDIYNVGGGSSSITPNPSGASTATLDRIQIDGIIYSVDNYVTAGRRPDSTLGQYATAEGSLVNAMQNYCHAEGYQTNANQIASHVEGYATKIAQIRTDDMGGHAEGYGTYGQGAGVHTEGYYTSAYSRHGAHAEGYYTTASSDGAHAEGENTYADGSGAHAEGYYTTAKSTGAHAEGTRTYAGNYRAHAEGFYTSAMSNNSHAEGGYTYAYFQGAHAQGLYTTANNTSACSMGHYNAAMTAGGSVNDTIGTAFAIGNGINETALSNAFSVQFDGTVAAAGSITGANGADYAEYFEWSDNNENNEDRVGRFVTFDNGKKIRLANKDDNYILGIVSGSPFVIGNADCDVWNGMFLKDEYGRQIMETYPVTQLNENGEEEFVFDEDGKQVYSVRPKINPQYDSTQKYIKRKDRPEWATVGMLGVLIVEDDGTCEVNDYCTVNQNGIATKANDGDKNIYRVVNRKTDKIIEIVFR